MINQPGTNMLRYLVTPMKLNDVIAILGVLSAAGSFFVFSTLKDVTGTAINDHNLDQYSHPSISERDASHDRQLEMLSRDIMAVNATMVSNQQIWSVVQAQNEKNHAEVMEAIREIQRSSR